MKEKKKMSLAMQIFIALVLAIIAGLLMQNYADFANSYIKPFGTIFLNLVKFIVVPIVLFSIMLTSPNAAFHFQSDQIVHFHCIFKRQFLGYIVCKSAYDHGSCIFL